MEREQLRRHGVFAGVVAVAVLATLIASVTAHERSGRETVRASGERASASYDLSGFEAVHLRGGYDLEVVAGKKPAIEITGDKAILEALEVRVEDGTLEIGPRDGQRIRDSDGVELMLHVPKLRAITVDGAVDGKLAALDSEEFALTVNGAADITLSGTCGAFSAVTNGAGDIDARNFHCESASVTVNGAGDMRIYASKSITAAVNGVGSIDIYGNPPEVRKMRAGIGSIRLRHADDS
ncbi:MAG: DUF2807 domain-containing protein [Alphaproteobacteria bacterium]|nr:MAG: DUF2807 domain-containing protein [Alphaproteobacteria bacterium]